MRPTYVLGFDAGARGHFIVGMILRLHRQDDSKPIYSELGNAHDYSGTYLWKQTTFYHIQSEYPIDQWANKVEFVGPGDDPFIILHPLWQHAGLDYNQRLSEFPNLKYVHINVNESEIGEIVAQEFYKSTLLLPDHPYSKEQLIEYLDLAKNRADCRTDGINTIADLNDHECRVYVEHRIEQRKPTYKKHVDERFANIPKEMPCYNIEYTDIVDNKDKVLSTLEEATGCLRTKGIEDVYDQYVEKQLELHTSRMGWVFPKY